MNTNPEDQDDMPDPLADPKYWRYRMRCRNCNSAHVDYLVTKVSAGSSVRWESFYQIHRDRLTAWLACEGCGAFAVHDMIAMSRQLE